VLTGLTAGFVREPRKGLWGLGTLCERQAGRGRRLAGRGSTPCPHPIQEPAEAKQSEEQEYVEKQVVSHVVPFP
jgi:hypothetical protein